MTSPATPIDLEAITLTPGSHARRADGVCLLEAVAWFAGEPHSHRPPCVDPALVGFGWWFNDILDDEDRVLLKPLIPLLVGTRGSDDLACRRAFLLVDRHLRSIIPQRLREVGYPAAIATKLEGLDPILDRFAAIRACGLLRVWCDHAPMEEIRVVAKHVFDAVATAATMANDGTTAVYAYPTHAARMAAAWSLAKTLDAAPRRRAIEQTIMAIREAVALKE